jgi:hypothetical protein
METPINEPVITAEFAQLCIFYICASLAALSAVVLYKIKNNRDDIDNSKI